MSGRAWHEDDVTNLKHWVDKGYSAAEIALKMNKTRSQILGYCHRHKIELARRKTDEPMKDQPPRDRSKKPPYAGNGHFNVKRATELAKEPMTETNWPKAENPSSIDIMEAQLMQCRMPLWDNKFRTGKVCGRERLSSVVRNIKVPKSPYCSSCHPLAYSPYIRR